MIYIIGNRELDVCKIGFSERPKRRIETIRKSFPFKLEIFKIFDGDRTDENKIHIKYSESRIKGEWFTLSKLDLFDLKLNAIDFLGGKISINEDYFLLSDIINVINKFRGKSSLSPFNVTSFLSSNSTKLFIDSCNRDIELIINNGFGKWIHKYLFIEICRASGAKEKLFAYNFFFKDVLRDNHQAIKLGISKAIQK